MNSIHCILWLDAEVFARYSFWQNPWQSLSLQRSTSRSVSREGLALRATLSERARGLRKGMLHRLDLDGMERLELDMAGYGWIHGWGIQDGVAEWLNWNRDLMYLDVTCVFICSLKHTSCKHTSCAAAFIFGSPSQKESLRLEAPKRHPSFPTGSHSLCSNRGCDLLWKNLEDFAHENRSNSIYIIGQCLFFQPQGTDSGHALLWHLLSLEQSWLNTATSRTQKCVTSQRGIDRFTAWLVA